MISNERIHFVPNLNTVYCKPEESQFFVEKMVTITSGDQVIAKTLLSGDGQKALLQVTVRFFKYSEIDSLTYYYSAPRKDLPMLAEKVIGFDEVTADIHIARVKPEILFAQKLNQALHHQKSAKTKTDWNEVRKQKKSAFKSRRKTPTSTN